MEAAEISVKVKEIINNVTSIPVEEIGDEASLRDELDLDSLSLMEIGVDVDYAFKLGLPDETLQKIGSVRDAVELVQKHLNGNGNGNAA
ncbi:MAG: acyl carrier protein [Acidobacteriota bacterium]